MTKLQNLLNENKSFKEALESDTATKIALLKNNCEMQLILINSILEDEMQQYAGERYNREKPYDGRYSRWGSNPSSVYIGEEKVPINVPRLYDKEAQCHKPIETFEKLKEIVPDEGRLMNGILNGLSTNNYKSVVEHFLSCRGLSRSNVSRRFIEESTKLLKEFMSRDFSEEKFVSIFIDGKYFQKSQIVIALGITEDGRKIALGFVQTTTENSTAIKGLLTNLIDRGLKFEEGILFVIDGSRGLHKAIEETFGEYAVFQRCQWHKRENVLSYLNDKDKEYFKKRLKKAYSSESYAEAKSELMDIYNELLRVNQSAAGSLLEGLEETLTLHRLGLYEKFGQSFKTTNNIESLNSQIGKYTRNVKNWKTSDQRHRWIAVGLLESEKHMRRVNNHYELNIMRTLIKREVQDRINSMIKE